MASERPLDQIDYGILGALQNNARLSNKELAARVGLAPSSCLERVRRLKTTGHIRGYHAEIAPDSFGIGLQALVFVELSSHTRRSYASFRDDMSRAEEVLILYNVAGRHDFVVHVAVRDTDHLRAFALDDLGARDDVRRVETSLVFEVERSPLPNFRDESTLSARLEHERT